MRTETKQTEYRDCRVCGANLDTGGHLRGCGNSRQYDDEPLTRPWPVATRLGFKVNYEPGIFGSGRWSVFGPDGLYVTCEWLERDAQEAANDYATNLALALLQALAPGMKDYTE